MSHSVGSSKSAPFRSVFKLLDKITAESEEEDDIEDDNISTPSELERN